MIIACATPHLNQLKKRVAPDKQTVYAYRLRRHRLHKKGCTTYVAVLRVEQLEKLGVAFLDYPSLVRLNPNVPWKTRGNGALCLRNEYDKALEDKIKELTTFAKKLTSQP